MTPPDAVTASITSTLTVAHRLDAPAVLAAAQRRDLLDSLAQIADLRHRCGRRHTLGALLAVAVGAMRANRLSAVTSP